MNIGIIGLGYVGLPLGVELSKNFNCIGYDINDTRISDLKKGIDSTLEVSPLELQNSTIKFTSENKMLAECNFYIVTVPTPIDKFNIPDLSPLKSACKTLSPFIKKNDIIVFESTVYPGCTEEFCVPILEKYSKLKFNQDFFCGYSPERINPGDKFHTVRSIKKIISGSNPHITDVIERVYEKVVDAGLHRAPSIKVAEAAKVIENSQRDINIAFVNELHMLFDKLDINIHDVLEAAGTKWNFLNFKPGLVGGHCIGVDPYYLAHKATEVGFLPEIILGGRRINENYVNFIQEKFAFETIKRFSDLPLNSLNILVLGATFKENCPDTRNSKVLEIINGLTGIFSNVSVYDPYLENETKFLKKKELGKYHGILIAVGHEEFKTIPFDSLCISKQSYIMDLKKILNF